MGLAGPRMIRKFDLNVDKVLETWEPAHALRELIANAVDEQILSGTAPISVSKNQEGEWLIRDYGRGLSYEHLIQSENPEKLTSKNTIGKFGVGLKDALATFWRHDIPIVICSKYGDITLERTSKHAFEEVLTLHACVDSPSQPGMAGTEIRIASCPDSEIEAAQRMFLQFKSPSVVGTTEYGQIVSLVDSQPTVYLNGLAIAVEDNFLYSYNITSPTAAIKKALNRERMNVGRAAYSDRVKSILLSCNGETVMTALAGELELLESGRHHDEMAWLEVQAHAYQLLSKSTKVVFVTAEERTQKPKLVEYANSDGMKLVTIPARLQEKVISQSKAEPEKNVTLRNLDEYSKAFNDSFEFIFVPICKLNPSELNTFQLAESVLELLASRCSAVKEILISETMRDASLSGFDADGLWQDDCRIIIKRDLLQDGNSFLGVLLHELAHARSGATDVTLAFENELTQMLGEIAMNAIDKIELLESAVGGKAQSHEASVQKLSVENRELKVALETALRHLDELGRRF